MNPIEEGKKIWEIFNIVQEFVDAFKKEREEVRQANALLVLLRRMAAKETPAFDLKEFKVVLPHANLNWNVRYAYPNTDSFIIDFKPDHAVMESKQIGVNLGMLKQLPNMAIIVVFGRDANEIDPQQPQTAKAIVEWMGKQEDELTMAYGRRERQRIGR